MHRCNIRATTKASPAIAIAERKETKKSRFFSAQADDATKIASCTKFKYKKFGRKKTRDLFSDTLICAFGWW